MSDRSPLWQAISAVLVAAVVWVTLMLAAWFADRTDFFLGHGPLPSGFTTINAYIATLLTGVLGVLTGGATMIGVRQGKYFTPQFAWLIYALVAGPLLLILVSPMQRFGYEAFMGLPEFLVRAPGRMVVSFALGALLIGNIDVRRLLPGFVSEAPAKAPATRPSGSGVRGLPGRFTPNAWRALSFMQEEAQRFEHSYMGTEHLLLGLLREPRSHSCRAIVNLGGDPSNMKREIESVIGRRGSLLTGTTGMTRRCQRVIEQAARVARGTGERVVGTGHLLQSLVEQPEDVAGQLLESSGVTADKVAGELRHMGSEAE